MKKQKREFKLSFPPKKWICPCGSNEWYDDEQIVETTTSDAYSIKKWEKVREFNTRTGAEAYISTLGTELVTPGTGLLYRTLDGKVYYRIRDKFKNDKCNSCGGPQNAAVWDGLSS